MEEFALKQKVAYRILNNSIKNKKISHAYIIETNGYLDYYNFVLNMAKEILSIDCNEKNIEDKINANSYPDLKILSTENLQYKKDDVKSLINEFKTKPINGKYKIYIIKDADKLSNSTSNALLKFLEEPEEGIVAILVVENKYQLLKTIISRCQIISLNNTEVARTIEDFYLQNEYSYDFIQEDIKNINMFVVSIEKNKKNAILYENKFILNNFATKEEIKKVLEIMKLIYVQAINCKNGLDIEYFDRNEKIIQIISEINTNEQLLKKITIIIENEKKLYFNVNINLLIDKLIIELGGC